MKKKIVLTSILIVLIVCGVTAYFMEKYYFTESATITRKFDAQLPPSASIVEYQKESIILVAKIKCSTKEDTERLIKSLSGYEKLNEEEMNDCLYSVSSRRNADWWDVNSTDVQSAYYKTFKINPWIDCLGETYVFVTQTQDIYMYRFGK
ncbi:hypothetical protein SDC9_102263 [bioreactor metagenome]|uniref:Uncharacterized protein n=1 Tax=bioreactor metagenome TaxID=1076179 RepID=A0A645ARC6_9ZZZZ